jgi:hypothetical protein
MRRTVTLLAIAAACAATPALAADELVFNGDFEMAHEGVDGLVGWDAPTGDWGAGFNVQTLNDLAANGCVGAACVDQAVLRQTLATVPGGVYQLSFDLEGAYGFFDGPSTPGVLDEQLRVRWGGSLVADLFTDSDGGEFLHHVFYGLKATGASTVLSFGGRNDAAFLYLDNVSVIQTGFEAPGDGNGNPVAAPEPAAWALMILGFGAAGWSLRRRRLSIA